MAVNPIQYRTISTVKNDLRDRNVAGYYFTRKNLARLPDVVYKDIMTGAEPKDVTRVVVHRDAVRVEASSISPDQIEQAIGPRAIMPGAKLDTRELPIFQQKKSKSFISRLGHFATAGLLKLLQAFYAVKTRVVKSDLTLVQFMNPAGEKMTAIFDYPEGKDKTRDITWVIVPPAFGKRKETYFLLALYLKKNGFGVVRYDDSNSIGESDGEIKNTTLTRSTENILTIVELLAKKYGAKKIGVIPFSLSARPAIKAATLDKRINFLLPIVGSPSIQTLLHRVYGEDLIADYRAGLEKGILNLLGHFIDSSNFLGNAHKHGFADLESTARDMKELGIPVVWYCGSDDPWVSHEEVNEVLRVNPMGQHRELKVFEGLTHRFREAEKAHEIFAQVVRDIAMQMDGHEIKEVVRPRTGEVIERAIRERTRIRKLVTTEEKMRMWTNYLEGFDILLETDDYMNYLADMDKIIDFKPNERLLDGGTGNANLINFLLGKLINDIVLRKCEGSRDGQIIGLDLVAEALARAESLIAKTKIKHSNLPPVEFLQHDIEGDKLPFQDWYFDKVAASLLLSYLKNPQAAVAELCRVLKLGGTIVITSLKPDADISQIYFRFIEKVKRKYSGSDQAGLWQRARDLFNAAISWIEGKEEEGTFRYLSATEMRTLLQENGVSDVKILKSFGDQVIIAYGKKTS